MGYLSDDDPGIRGEAAITCANLLLDEVSYQSMDGGGRVGAPPCFRGAVQVPLLLLPTYGVPFSAHPSSRHFPVLFSLTNPMCLSACVPPVHAAVSSGQWTLAACFATPTASPCA